jgi:D-alanyl-D-alanine carboxypeptidase
MRSSNSHHKKYRTKNITFSLMIVLALAGALLTIWRHPKDPVVIHTGGHASVNFNKTQHSINDPASIWVVVNKGRVLPDTYVPADLVTPHVPLRLAENEPEMYLRQAAASALEKMSADADTQGIHLMLASAYRSYRLQVGLYNGYVKTQGQNSADASSARPGHSEHQTGLAADLEPQNRKCEVELCFSDTKEGRWLAKNAYEYGFIIRYQKGQEILTGYEYEPWHVRYVGNDLALQIHKSGQTLEQFFGLTAYSDYPKTYYQLAAGK